MFDIEILKLITQYGGGALIIYLIILLIKELGKYKKNNGGDIEKLSNRIDKMEGNDLHTIGENIKYLRGEVDELRDKVASLDKSRL
jgi:polyhydroxyalkanoate synthesis regulator phasin